VFLPDSPARRRSSSLWSRSIRERERERGRDGERERGRERERERQLFKVCLCGYSPLGGSVKRLLFLMGL